MDITDIFEGNANNSRVKIHLLLHTGVSTYINRQKEWQRFIFKCVLHLTRDIFSLTYSDQERISHEPLSCSNLTFILSGIAAMICSASVNTRSSCSPERIL